MNAYEEFLRSKMITAPERGIAIDASAINPLLKAHQAAIVRWAVHKGNAAIFAAFGLGKTFMQLEIARLIQQHDGGKFLIVAPLGVRQEFRRDAEKLGIELRFVRRFEECRGDGIFLTNYETIRDQKMDPRKFAGCSLDEAAILRGFGGTKTFREFMRVFENGQVRYKFVATATPSPNEYIELLAYAAFLDVMDVSQAKTRFFKRDSTQADNLTLHEHKKAEFWLWVSSWAIFLQKPSDLCRCSCHAESISKASASVSSLLTHGKQVNGYATAIAEEKERLPPITYWPDKLSVADVPDQNMAERGQELSLYGKACSTDAHGQTTRTGQTMEAEALSSADDGSNSSTFSPTCVNRQQEQPSRERTTPEITNRVIASGQPENSKPAILDGPSSSPITEKQNPSLHGQNSSTLTTGFSTQESKNLDGPPSAHSRTWCDQCRCDDGYELPPMEVYWHEIPSDNTNAGHETSGQGRLVRSAAIGVTHAAKEKRESLPARIAKMMELREQDRNAHRVIWHDLESERRAIENAIPMCGTVYGSQDLDQREGIVMQFADGKLQELAGKPSMLGAGNNFQRYCAWSIFLGIGFKFHEFIQAVHRNYRFLQLHPVRLDLIYTEAEREVRRVLQEKWDQHNALVAQMSAIIREYGLATNALEKEMARSFGTERHEVAGENYRLVLNDSVVETQGMPEASVHLILSSIPFSTQYEYTPSYNDFGHTESNEQFWEQMGFLIPELYRVLQPGRACLIHVKDRITPGGLSGMGFQTAYPFHCDAIRHFQRGGFAYLGMKTIVTDVVRENNQTYRLGWTEQCKDGSRMGVGMPEYLLLFRKPPTDSSKGYADVPVVKDKTEYSRSRWQIDAHGFARSSGNRLLTRDEIRGMPHERIYKRFREMSLGYVYDFEQHVGLGEELEVCAHCSHIHLGVKDDDLGKVCGVALSDEEIECPTCEGTCSVPCGSDGGKPCPTCFGERGETQGLVFLKKHCQCTRYESALPNKFMLLQPQSWHQDVWTDVTRMLSLNSAQSAAGREMHLCPMQFDLADRAIAQFSMPGEVVLDPFSGLGTVPLRAIKQKRRGLGIELSPAYFKDACFYCEAMERKMATPSLFDLLEMEAEAPGAATEVGVA